MALYGAFLDKQCEPPADGSPRFTDHDAYVTAFVAEVEALVGRCFLLPEDAQRLINQAALSNVGSAAASTGELALLLATGKNVAVVPVVVAFSVLLLWAGVTVRKSGKTTH